MTFRFGQYGEYELTGRELAVSIIMVLLSIFIITISVSSIHREFIGKNDKYVTANVLETQSLFDHGLVTHKGYSFIQANVEPQEELVGFPELKDKYVYVQRIRQEYVMKTRKVAYSCGTSKAPKTCYRNQTYWEWDTKEKETLHIDNFYINGYKINYAELSLPGDIELDLEDVFQGNTIDGKTIDKTSWSGKYVHVERGFFQNKTRYGYDVITKDMIKDGVMFVNFTDGKMEPGKDRLYVAYDGTVDEVRESIQESPTILIIILAVVVSAVTVSGVYAFIRADNDWLNGNKRYNNNYY